MKLEEKGFAREKSLSFHEERTQIIGFSSAEKKFSAAHKKRKRKEQESKANESQGNPAELHIYIFVIMGLRYRFSFRRSELPAFFRNRMLFLCNNLDEKLSLKVVKG